MTSLHRIPLTALRRARLLAGMTQADAVRAVPTLSRTRLSAVERGEPRNHISQGERKALARLYGVTLGELAPKGQRDRERAA